MDRFPGWGYPDVGDEGLPCAMASLLTCWAQSFDGRTGGNGVEVWSVNILHRLWMPGQWSARIDMDYVRRNLEWAPAVALTAMTALGGGNRFPGRNDDRWKSACDRFAQLAQPGFDPSGLHHLHANPEDAIELVELGGLLRTWWIARLHERNSMWDSHLDWADVDSYAGTFHWAGSRTEWHQRAVNRFSQLAENPPKNIPAGDQRMPTRATSYRG